MPRIRPILIGVTLVALAAPSGAQTTYDACYVPTVGAIYLIKQAGLPSACLAQAHVQFSWTSGGVIADGSVTTAMLADAAVTPAKLSFNPATQTELNAVTAGLAASGTINTSTNPVDWTQLKNVPAGFADGVDAGGAGTSDHGALTGLADDDHAQYLLTDGVRNATNGFAVTGTTGTGAIPATGTGVRLMWYPGKAALRAGAVSGVEWDDVNVGGYSTALGRSTTASGEGALASGWQATATGDVATALGFFTAAGSYGSLVIGRYNVTGGSPTEWFASDVLLVAGNGASVASRSNAMTLLKNGNLTIAGTLTQSSDIRFKEGIRTMDRALDGVLDLRPIYYRFREGTGHPTDEQIGLAAQEVEQIFPQLVHRDSEGKLSVAYTQLAAVLVRAVQEQQATIDALLQRIEQLERRSVENR